MSRLTLGLLSCLVAASSAAAETLLIRGAFVHVGDGTTVLEGADVRIENGRIAEIGRRLSAPAATRVVDARGAHLSPGLIAAPSSLGLVEIGAVRATRDHVEVGDLNPDVNAWIAFNPDSELVGVARAGGVLHALVAPQGGKVSGRSAVLELAGWTHEDMALKAPAALHVDWPNLRIDRAKDVKPPVAEQERLRAENLEAIHSLFAEARAYHLSAAERSNGRLPVGERNPRLEALGPVLDGRIPVVVKADDMPQMRAAIEWAREQGLRLVLWGGRDAWRMADEIRQAGVPVLLGAVRALPRRDHEPHDVAFMNPVHLHRAGVELAFTIGDPSNLRNLPDEAAMAIAYGLPPEAALAGISSTPARIFGVDAEIGTVAVGRRANLVLWDGPPLEIISRVLRVFIQGRELPMDDRHSRLHRKYDSRPSPTPR